MAAGQQPRIVIVTRETRMDDLLKRWATRGQVLHRFRAARAAAAVQVNDMAMAAAVQASKTDEDFEELMEEDRVYRGSVGQLSRGELDFGMPVQVLDREYVPTYDFSMCSVVVVVGQDGLVANTAKYAGGTPIVGVNPDPSRFDGVLLPFRVEEARGAVTEALNGRARVRPVTMAQATLHDGQSMLAFNDFFIGVRTHVSARYQIRFEGREEQHSSSGMIVSTGAGSTGWMSSVFNGASGIAASLGAPAPPNWRAQLAWEERRLLWAVREPFISRMSQATMVAGQLEEGEQLELESLTPENGVIFSDGIESDFLDFNGGTIARIGVAAQQAQLVVK
jgi:NAD kinase